MLYQNNQLVLCLCTLIQISLETEGDQLSQRFGRNNNNNTNDELALRNYPFEQLLNFYSEHIGNVTNIFLSHNNSNSNNNNATSSNAKNTNKPEDRIKTINCNGTEMDTFGLILTSIHPLIPRAISVDGK